MWMAFFLVAAAGAVREVLSTTIRLMDVSAAWQHGGSEAFRFPAETKEDNL